MGHQRTRTLVIGGGIAGVSLAYELAAADDVILLEAESSLATHSTGRSAALFLSDYGAPTVRSLTRASHAEFARGADEAETAPLLTPRGVLMTAWDEATAEALHATMEQEGSNLREITVEQARSTCPALRPEGLLLAAYDSSAQDIDVMALHARYVRGLRRRGASVHCGARVAAVDRTAHGWHVTDQVGRRWSADVLVNAAGAWGDHVADLIGIPGHDLTPCRRTIVIARPTSHIDQAWPVVADAGERWYFKSEGAALLLSPGDETPMPAGDVRPDPLDVAEVLERVNAHTTLDLRSVHTAWAGLRTFAPDRCPVVGWHPADPGLFCFLGQGGYGIQMAPALARVAAQLATSQSLDPELRSLADAMSPTRISPVPAVVS